MLRTLVFDLLMTACIGLFSVSTSAVKPRMPSRRKAAAELNQALDKIRAQPGKPMSEEEIQAEVNAARRERED